MRRRTRRRRHGNRTSIADIAAATLCMLLAVPAAGAFGFLLALSAQMIGAH